MSSALPPVVADLVEDEPPVAELVEEVPVARAVALPVSPADDMPVVARQDAPRGPLGLLGAVAEWCFGVCALFVGLAVLAAIPVGQFLALGYLLEAAGRVARSGRLRDGFIGVRVAARFGGAALAAAFLWLPLYFLSIQAQAARVISPEGRVAKQWAFWLTLLATLAALHGCAALLRGARFRDFFRPLNLLWLARRALRGGLYTEARDRLWNLVVGLRLWHYFWLGVRGFAGAFVWLALPLLLLAQGHRAPVVGIFGGLMLSAVVLYVPFLQARFARDNRLRAFREFKQVRAAFRRAPLAFAVALWVHLLLAIPLYILKIEVIPRDLVFLEGLLFLVLIFPARLLGGWAYARGARRATPRHPVARWVARLAVVPVVLAYVFVVFLSQHLGWQGIGSLYEQHAFLLPVPFVTWNG
jgi:hypothetical protein